MSEKINFHPSTKPSVPSGAWTAVLPANRARKALALANESASVNCRVALQEFAPTTAGEGFGFGPSFPIQTQTAQYDGPVYVYQSSGTAWAELVIQEGF